MPKYLTTVFFGIIQFEEEETIWNDFQFFFIFRLHLLTGQRNKIDSHLFILIFIFQLAAYLSTV